MRNELIKPIIRVGNSAGVLLPKEWLSGTARVELIKEPINIENDVLEILKSHLKDIIGLYLAGSYARGEEKNRSDVDILAVTNKTEGKIKQKRYNIILINKDSLKESMENNALPILPMLMESRAIINQDLIKEYTSKGLTKKNITPYIETTISALSVIKSVIDIDKESGMKSSDGTAYSLVLRLRSVYIVDCIMKNKKWSNKELVRLTKEISGSNTAYEGYLRVKDGKKGQNELPCAQAEAIYDYLQNGIKRQQAWLAKRK